MDIYEFWWVEQMYFPTRNATLDLYIFVQLLSPLIDQPVSTRPGDTEPLLDMQTLLLKGFAMDPSLCMEEVSSWHSEG